MQISIYHLCIYQSQSHIAYVIMYTCTLFLLLVDLSCCFIHPSQRRNTTSTSNTFLCFQTLLVIFLNFDKIFSTKRKPLYFARLTLETKQFIVMPLTIHGKIFHNTDFFQGLFVETPKLAILQKENKWKFLNKQSSCQVNVVRF